MLPPNRGAGGGYGTVITEVEAGSPSRTRLLLLSACVVVLGLLVPGGGLALAVYLHLRIPRRGVLSWALIAVGAVLLLGGLGVWLAVPGGSGSVVSPAMPG